MTSNKKVALATTLSITIFIIDKVLTNTWIILSLGLVIIISYWIWAIYTEKYKTHKNIELYSRDKALMDKLDKPLNEVLIFGNPGRNHEKLHTLVYRIKKLRDSLYIIDFDNKDIKIQANNIYSKSIRLEYIISNYLGMHINFNLHPEELRGFSPELFSELKDSIKKTQVNMA